MNSTNINVGAYLGASGGPMLAVVCVTLVVACAIALLYYIGVWMTLQKMGRHDFAALVPGYDMWELARGGGLKPGGAALFIALYVLAVGVFAFANLHANQLIDPIVEQAVRQSADFAALAHTLSVSLQGLILSRVQSGDVLLVVALAMPLVFFALQVYLYHGVSKAFGHKALFTLGLVFFAPIFFAILGCSKKQFYHGPLRDKDYLENPRSDWGVIVQSRLDTFGSNAPLALGVVGLCCGGFLLTLPGIVLCIVALVRNSGEKEKPLAEAKSRAATIVAVTGIVISVALLALAFVFGSSILALMASYGTAR